VRQLNITFTMRDSMLLLALVATFQAASAQGILPMSPEDYAQALANWNTTMTAHAEKSLSSRLGGSCSSDIRKKFPSCLQYDKMWCWATAVSEVASFYKPEKYPETGSDCHGVECKVVSHKMTPNDLSSCCGETPACSLGDKNTCCKNDVGFAACEKTCGLFSKEVNASMCKQHACGDAGGGVNDIIRSIKFFAGELYTSRTTGPLRQEKLDQVLSKGNPVVIAVFWTGGGGHVLTLGGCSGGKYYVHDPENKQGVYQELTYEQVASYVPPEQPSMTGKWMWTFFPMGDDADSTDSGATLVV